MLPDILLMFSVGVITSIALGIALSVIAWRVAWWQGWTDDE